MADETLLPAPVLQRLASLKTTDIAVGIATFNHAGTVGPVVEAVQSALRDPLSGHRGVVILADGGSTDGTVDTLTGLDAEDAPILQLTYPVLPGQKLAAPGQEVPDKAGAVKTILGVAQRLQAKACVLVTPNLRGITPASVAALARPVLDGQFDFVSPLSTRHRFDGLMTSGLICPLLRTLYGKRVRQPMGGDVALSAGLIGHCLSPRVWESDKGRIGVDLWLAAEAFGRGYKLGQARVGALSHVVRESSQDLSTTLAQVLSELFDLTTRDVSLWQRQRGSEAIPTFGVAHDVPQTAAVVDAKKLIESFGLGYKNLQPVWGAILPPATMLVLKRMAAGLGGNFSFPDQTWVRTVFDFALGYRLRTMNREHLLRAFTPLYLAWAASFALETQDAGDEAAEHRLEALCLAFESEKPYLISRWRWPDRFNP